MPSPWPTIIDDIGDWISGTIHNKALFDDIQTYIDSLTRSSGNPAVFPPDTTDEVVAARGSMSKLDTRLDVSLNDDGTLKPITGQASAGDVKRATGQGDLARNRFLDWWDAGGAAAPSYYVLVGAGATVAQAGVGMGDTTQVGAGRFCAKVTSAPGLPGQLVQVVIASTDMTNYTSLRGRKVNLIARVKAASAGLVRCTVTDGVNSSTGNYNTTTAEEDINVQHTIAATATSLSVYVEVALGTNVGYIGAISVVFGDQLPDRWEVSATPELFRSAGPVTLYRQVGSFASNTVLANSSFSWPMPANTLLVDGQALELTMIGTLAANVNAKSLKIYIGTSFVIPFSTSVNTANNKFTVRLLLTRSSVSTVAADGLATKDAASSAAPTVVHLNEGFAGGAIDLSTAQTIKFELITPTANADMVVARTVLKLWP